MVRCPVCGSEHTRWSYMSTHMILTAINRSYEHERYLNLITGKDQHVWGHKRDAAVGNLMRKIYKKYGRLPSLNELEGLNDETEEW